MFLHQGRFLKAIEEFEPLVQGDGDEAPRTDYLQPLAAAYAASEENGRGARFFQRMAKKGGGPAFKIAAAVLHWNSHEDVPLLGPIKRGSALKLIKEAESEASGTDLALYALRLRHRWENASSP